MSFVKIFLNIFFDNFYLLQEYINKNIYLIYFLKNNLSFYLIIRDKIFYKIIYIRIYYINIRCF